MISFILKQYMTRENIVGNMIKEHKFIHRLCWSNIKKNLYNLNVGVVYFT